MVAAAPEMTRKMTMTSTTTERFFLVGFMAAGKTTLGRVVAERLGLPFEDLDSWIEKSSGRTVSEIFAIEGESGFRARESEALVDVVRKCDRAVIATGGGAYTIEANRLLMRESGTVVWLDVPVEEIATRIQPGTRPLWTEPDEARLLHERRRTAYRLADHHLDLAKTEPEEAAERLYRLLLECRNHS